MFLIWLVVFLRRAGCFCKLFHEHVRRKSPECLNDRLHTCKALQSIANFIPKGCLFYSDHVAPHTPAPILTALVCIS